MRIKKVIRWTVMNRRILGTIFGSLLVAFGYEREGAYITDVSGHI